MKFSNNVVFPHYLEGMQMKKLLALLFFVVACSSENDTTISSEQYKQVGDVDIGLNQKCSILDTTSIFVPCYPAAQYANMKSDDRPSFADVRNAAFYKGAVYLAAYGAIVKIVANPSGKILAFSNPSVLLQPKHVVVQNDTLFVASQVEGVGVYQIHLPDEQTEAQYNETTGLKNTQNLELYKDGTYIWVGTFHGVGRIDPKTHAVKFYETASELNSPCALNNIRIHVRGTEVWAQVYAHAECSGAALHYDRANDSWTRYGVEAFDPTMERIDFLPFIVSDVGVFAQYQTEMPGVVSAHLRKFDPETDTWPFIANGNYNDQKSMDILNSKLPPKSTYSDSMITEEQVDQFDQFKIQINDGDDWESFHYSAAELSAKSITKNPIADNYLFVSHTGLYIMNPEDLIPQSAVSTHVLNYAYTYEFDLTFTADNKMLVVYQAYTGEEIPENIEHQFLVYDQTTRSGFGFALPMGNSEVYVPSVPTTLTYFFYNGRDHGETKLLFTNGYGSFEIDLVAKTVVKTK